MGQINSQNKKEKALRNHFAFKHIIGRGGFGKVWKVAYKKTNTYYALKVMSKPRIIDRKSEQRIMAEREILSKLHHPYATYNCYTFYSFLINMIYAFQDPNNIYLVMDLLQGGDLRFHIDNYHRFSEEQTKFFMACIIIGLEYIHDNNIIHRDIKPENLVFDEKGYLRITDFGIAHRNEEINEEETSGTPNYMAPEVLYGKQHNKTADYYALGVIGYECMFGTRPYKGKTRSDIRNSMLCKIVNIKDNEVPYGYSFEAADLMNKLLERKTSKRLGENGIAEIKNHPWFNNFNWDDLANKSLRSPFYPGRGDNYDKKFCEAEEMIGLDTQERYQAYKDNPNYKSVFNHYTYNNISHDDTSKNSDSTRSSPKEALNEKHVAFKVQMIHKRIKVPTKDSFTLRSYIALNSTKSKHEDQVFTPKNALPLINPTPLQKSSSSMSIYKTNRVLPHLSRKQNSKDSGSLSPLKRSFHSPIKKISHKNFGFKDQVDRKNLGSTILLREFKHEVSQVM